jgi:5-oxoprolinase (ATP-hydrolysing)
MSKTLREEGAAIIAYKLVEGGIFQEAGITEILMKVGLFNCREINKNSDDLQPGTLDIPGCSGSRNLKDCISDLRAQVAANNKGIHLVTVRTRRAAQFVCHIFIHIAGFNC